MINSPEFGESLIVQNELIFKRIESILEKKGEYDEVIHAHYGTLQNIMKPDLIVDMGVAYDETARDTAMGLFTDFPKGFQFPAAFFSEWQRQEETMIRTTPYGFLNSLIIGKDGRLYMFENIFFIGQNGQAKKSERVIRPAPDIESAEEALRRMGWDINKITRVEFIPQEEDSRYVDLDGEDYEKIKKILEQVESGEYI